MLVDAKVLSMEWTKVSMLGLQKVYRMVVRMAEMRGKVLVSMMVAGKVALMVY